MIQELYLPSKVVIQFWLAYFQRMNSMVICFGC